MKIRKFLLYPIACLAFGLCLASCGNKANHSVPTEQADQQGKEYTSAYICPMHCEGSGSSNEGVCPVCGMDYVQNKEHQKDEHMHDGHMHDGHNHDGQNH